MTASDILPDPLELLQRRSPSWESADGLLSLLAALPLAAEPIRGRLGEAVRSALDETWTDLARWLEAWPPPPEGVDALRSWLADSEKLGLARAAFETLGAGTSSVRALLPGLLERFGADVRARDDHWRFAGDAEHRLRTYGLVVEPWSWFDGGTAAAAALASSELGDEVCQLWINSRLHSVDEKQLRDELSRDSSLRAALRRTLERATSDVHVTHWTPDWSLDVARNEDELPLAAELLRVRLPPGGGEVCVRQRADGTSWSYPDGRQELVTHGEAQHVWRYAALGEFSTRIHLHEPNTAQDAWHGLASLRRVAEGEGGKRGPEVVAAIISALGTGALSDALRRGHEAFEAGEELTVFEERLVSHAVESRIVVPDALRVLSDAGVNVERLTQQLGEVDEKHAEHASAVQLVDDGLYSDLTRGVPLDLDAWWGARAKLDATVPAAVVERALANVTRAAKTGGSDNVVPFPQHELAKTERPVLRLAAADFERVESGAMPCPWLSSDRAPAVGRVPLLLFDEANQRGVLAELRVELDDRMDEREVWSEARPLERLAREVIRDAYYACASLGMPPVSFAHHRFWLKVHAHADASAIVVDGRSVGLPAALAIASAWAKRPLPADIAALGTVLRWGGVGPVGEVEKKCASLRDAARLPTLRVLCHSQNTEQVTAGGLPPIPTDKLRDALVHVGIDLTAVRPIGSIRNRKEKLAELIGAIRDGDVTRYGERATWQTLGDLARFLVETLANELPARNLGEARCWAALAYSHAGLLGDVGAMLRGVERPTELGLEIRALFDIAKVGACIDRGELATVDGQRLLQLLEDDLVELRAAHASEMTGRAAGTLGRAYMHAGRVEDAVPLLEEGVRHHAEHEPHETPRSRVYLAMALRMAGQPDEAMDQLVTADGELSTATRNYSPEYEQSTRMYFDYEMARVLLALDRFEDAITCARRALERSEWLWWPRLGARRTLAWALRSTGRSSEADKQVAEMRAMDVPDDCIAFKERLAVEAEGYPVEGGEVY